ncbi:MAG: FHA domain-containing protein [Actinomycetota bacterium]|nr:FHA domain-containing protein [Actinomycetota bacterium]
MNVNRGEPSGPWVGLRAYTASDRLYFYGRERDVRIVGSNLRARRLTVLYGSTGIGKSSLLQAGVVPTVQRKQPVLMFDEWQSPSFFDELKRRCLEFAGDGVEAGASDLPLDELIAAAAAAHGMPVLIVFDQFEEYFVAHPPAADGVGFEPELARAVNRPDVHAGFLISLREDALAGMDRFQPRIPNLLRNLLRIEHLTRETAETAVRKSLDAWNEENGAAVEIEDGLVEALLDDVSLDQRVSTLASTAAETPRDAVEAPFLQLVLERLWAVEIGSDKPVLRLRTYEALGRAEGIVARHFAEILERLTPAQQEVCARFFDRLVTPSGGKISYPVADLDDVALELAGEVPDALKVLKDARILREVDTGGRRAIEIYHDVLAPTILEWQTQIVRRRERAEERRRRRRRLATTAVVLTAILGGIAYVAYSNWRATRPWGTLTELRLGNGYQLGGAQIIVGRSVPGQKADVSFSDRSVSRTQLLVYRSGRAIDLRSLLGTTVNGRFVEYGQGAVPLRPGDVIVVGGVGVLRYQRVEYPIWHVWTPAPPKQDPAEGWALLVTGRSVRLLSRRTHYLSLVGDDVVASGSATPDALATVAPGLDGVEAFDTADGVASSYQCAEANGESYPTETLRDGFGFKSFVPHCVLIVRGHRVQVVPIASS